MSSVDKELLQASAMQIRLLRMILWRMTTPEEHLAQQTNEDQQRALSESNALMESLRMRADMLP
jgi:hypothetical protein